MNKRIFSFFSVSLSLLLSLDCMAQSIFNQTPYTTPVLPNEDSLPFRISIELEDFSLPQGLHSYVFGSYHGKWLLLAGRTNGLHGFDPTGDFPSSQQNTTVFVVDPIAKRVSARSLLDPGSGLTQEQIDTLSVVSSQYYQQGKILYMTGGYGIDTATNTFSTKPVLTEINIPRLIKWVENPFYRHTASLAIRQLTDPLFQVTGGYMDCLDGKTTLLVFGQNFEGEYNPGSNGNYTMQVRRFKIHNGQNLSIKPLSPDPLIPDPNYRRRDLNVLRVVKTLQNRLKPALVAFSGVFTEAGGIWTVPVEITDKGSPSMADPTNANTFKQGMNNYVSAAAGLYSKSLESMYNIILGGLSYGYFVNGVFQTDDEIPFINQVTTIQIDRNGNYLQYIMSALYPTIYSDLYNPPRQMLFGTAALFIPRIGIPQIINKVIDFDSIHHSPVTIGHIVGGIMSSLPNTTTRFDSLASPYIFKVRLERIESSSSH